MGQAEIRPNASPVLLVKSMKRKRGEIADSESEHDEAASDLEFGWAADDDTSDIEGLLEDS